MKAVAAKATAMADMLLTQASLVMLRTGKKFEFDFGSISGI